MGDRIPSHKRNWAGLRARWRAQRAEEKALYCDGCDRIVGFCICGIDDDPSLSGRSGA